MKHLLLFAIAVLNFAISSTAQTKDKELVALTNEACTCFAKHNPVKDKQFDKIIQTVYDMPPSDADAYVRKLPDEQLLRFSQNMDKIDQLYQTNSDFKTCLDSWEVKTKDYFRRKEATGAREEPLIKLFVQQFKYKKKCRILGLTMFN